MAAAAKPVLIYFPIPARGEIARLAFTLGKVDFEDKRIPPQEWAELKATTPFGQVPLLQVGDTVVAQSGAIDHYAAKVAGLAPEDPLLEAVSDETYFFVTSDIHTGLLSPIMAIKDPEQQVKARQELAEGRLKERLGQLEKLVASRRGKWLTGDKLSLGDLAVFNILSMFRSGWWKGVPTDIVSHFPALKAFRNSVATLPAVAVYYAAATDDLRKAGYTPDSE